MAFQILYNKGKTGFVVVFPDGRETETRLVPEGGVCLIPDDKNNTAIIVKLDGPSVEEEGDAPSLTANTVYELKEATTEIEYNVEDLGEPQEEEGEEEEEDEGDEDGEDDEDGEETEEGNIETSKSETDEEGSEEEDTDEEIYEEGAEVVAETAQHVRP